MEYREDNGTKLFGYSLVDLNKNTEAVNRQTKVMWAFIILFIIIILLGVGLFLYLDYHNILSNIVNRCVC